MAGEIATAYIELLPSLKGGAAAISKQLDGPAEEAGRSAGEKAGHSMASAIGNVLKAGAVAGTGLLVGLGAAGLKAGIQTASGMEQARISFTTMLKSGDKADAFLGKLQAFAAKTPFEFPELQTAASSLISVGINADKVIPIMTSLGNATSGMGTGAEGVKRATVALQQMNAAGRITGEDLNQLRDAGVPVFDLLAAATGKSVEQVAQLAQQGKLGKKELEQLMAALESGKGLERFAGLMDQQSTSLKGLWSTFKDTINMGLATAVQPLIPVLKDGLGQATAFAAAQMPNLATGLANVVSHLPAAVAWVQNLWDKIQGLWNLVVHGDFTKQLGDAFNWSEDDTAVTTIIRIRDAISGVFDLVKRGNSTRLSEAIGVEPATLDSIRTSIVSVKDSIGQFFASLASSDFSGFKDTFAQLGPLVTNFSGSLPAVNSAIETTSSVFGFVAEHIDKVVAAMPFLLAAFAAYKTLQIANNALGKDSLIGFGIQIVQTGLLTAANFLLASSIRASNTAQNEAIAASGISVASKVKDTAATVASTVAKGAAAAATGVVTAAQWLWNAALSANPIGLVVIAIAALVAALIWAWNNSETFREIVLKVWAEVKARVLGVIDWFKQAVPAAFEFVKNAFLQYTILGLVISHWGQIMSFITEKVDAIKRWVSEGWANILETTSRIFASIVVEVRSRLAGLLDTVTGPIRSVLQWIGEHFVNPLNDMLSKVGVDFRIPWPSFASGGPIPGIASAGRMATGGTVLGHSANARSDNIPIWATANEFMIRQWSSLRLRRKYPGLLEYMNEHGRLPGGYADGGVIRKYADGGSVLDTVRGYLSNIGRFFTDPVGAIGDFVSGLLSGIGGGFWAQTAGGALKHVVGGLVAKVKEMISSMGAVGEAEYLGNGRVSIQGKWLDATTAGIFQKAYAILGGLSLFQGSWSSSVGASAGTHSGAGAMDVWPFSGNARKAVDVLRSLGDIAWWRHSWQGFSDHIHGITPNVPGLSPQAFQQVLSFRAGRNGLASGGPDNNGYWRGGKILLADNGTILAPGLNLVQNNTGAPEPLVRPERGRQIVINGNVGYDPRELARLIEMRDRDEDAIAGLTAQVVT